MKDNRTNLVAVYGSLLKGLGNHGCLQGAKYINKHVLKEGQYKMYSYGSFPFLHKDTNGRPIKIELYKVDERGMERLDMLEGYPSFYDREKVSTPYGDAWIYFLKDEDCDFYTEVTSGDWKRFIRQ